MLAYQRISIEWSVHSTGFCRNSRSFAVGGSDWGRIIAAGGAFGCGKNGMLGVSLTWAAIKIICFFLDNGLFLREPQHTPGAYPRHPNPPNENLYKLLVEGLGYVLGACWKYLRLLSLQSVAWNPGDGNFRRGDSLWKSTCFQVSMLNFGSRRSVKQVCITPLTHCNKKLQDDQHPYQPTRVSWVTWGGLVSTRLDFEFDCIGIFQPSKLWNGSNLLVIGDSFPRFWPSWLINPSIASDFVSLLHGFDQRVFQEPAIWSWKWWSLWFTQM